ncbi:MAG: HEAT repeat domain-containing protein [Prochloron sp. SP5CPC1]|nr:HEAT repeat domain-containing protein [Candidatus Paraprochloron terpiosi SP5CPC1]
MNDNELDLLNIESPTGEREPPTPDPEAILPLLSHPETKQRMLAARVFCDLEDTRSIPQLIKLLADDCALVRVSAAYALGRNTSPDAVESLIEQLKKDWNGYARKGIVWALGNSKDPRATQPLIHALKTDRSAVRLWAASGLATVAKLTYEDIIAAIPPLIQGLRRDSTAAVRSNCAWSLGKLCRELPSNVVYATAIDALLESYVEDEDLGVKEDAKAALLQVGDPRALQMIEELELEGLI